VNQELGILIAWSVKSALVVVAGYAFLFASRKMSASWRNALCRLTIVGVLAVPLLMEFGEIVGARTQAPALTSPIFVKPTPQVYVPIKPDLTPSIQVAPQTTTEEPTDLGPWIVSLYGFVALAGLVRLGGNVVKARRLIRHAAIVDSKDWGLPRHLRVLSIEGISSPAAFGATKPVILLPADSLQWPDARLEAAVRHEWAHVQRRDWVWQVLSQIMTATMWLNPMVWLIAREVRRTAELAADDRVLRSGIGRREYAQELVNIAAMPRTNPALVAMARAGGLKHRVQHILDWRTTPNTPKLVPKYAILCLLTASVVLLGAAMEHGLTPDPGVASFGPGKPFYGPFQLENGDVIRLEYVQDWNVSPNLLWLPNGQPVSTSVRAESLHFPAPPSDAKINPLHLRISTSRRRENETWMIQTPFTTTLATYMTYTTADSDKCLDMAAIHVPSGVRTTDIRVGIACGKWRSLGVTRLGEGTLHAQVVPSTHQGWWNRVPCPQYGPRDGEASPAKTPDSPRLSMAEHRNTRIYAGGMMREDNDACIEITVPPTLEDKEIVLKAYSTQFGSETEIPIRNYQIDCSGTGHFPNGRETFSYVGDPFTITHVELMVRDYEWTTFKGVRCQPNDSGGP